VNFSDYYKFNVGWTSEAGSDEVEILYGSSLAGAASPKYARGRIAEGEVEITVEPGGGISSDFPDFEVKARRVVNIDGREYISAWSNVLTGSINARSGPTSVILDMFYADSSPGPRSDQTTLYWSNPGTLANIIEAIEVFTNKDIQSANTIDTRVAVASYNAVSFNFPADYWVDFVQDSGSENWPTVGVRYRFTDGTKSDVSLINFTMPNSDGFHSFS